MAIIPQLALFSWKNIEPLGDLERLRLVLEHLPDEALMAHLEKSRGHGPDFYSFYKAEILDCMNLKAFPGS